MLFVGDGVGVAAATCFEPGIGYERYGLIVGKAEAAPVHKARFTKVIPHPSFNPETFSNNIAIVMFPPLQPDTGRPQAFAASPEQWESKLHGMRGMTDANTWNDWILQNHQFLQTAGCAARSPLARDNPTDFMCSEAMLPSQYKQGCRLPFQYIYVSNGGKVAQAALYSHSSASSKESFCSNDVITNYYLNVANYVPWIASTIQGTVTNEVLPNGPAAPSNAAYKMSEPPVSSRPYFDIFSIFHGGRIYSLSKPVEVSGVPVDLRGQPLESAISIRSVETTTTTTTMTTTTTVEASTVTESTTTTQTTTSTVPSTVPVTSTASHTVTSTASSTTTLTTTDTQTSIVVASSVAMVTVTTDATTSSTATLTLTSTVSLLVCPLVTPCPAPGPGAGTTTVTQTTTATSTLVLTSYNFDFSGHVETGTGVQAPILATVTVTTTQKADTATVTTTVPAGSNPTTTSTTTVHRLVSATTTLPVKTVTSGSTSTVVSTEIDMESPPAQPVPPPQPWAIAMTIILLLLVMVVVGVLLFSWCRQRKRSRRQDDCPYFENQPPAYPPDYYSQGDVKGYAQTSYTHDERRSRYNSQGSYVGYY
ncbi:hypothetical protein IWQ57_001351 [Coemansia nantahalensis]|uniref:Uncharacterized protein n=1 Tax=Coemansia nantahalensis TaxID=2789366 RepID=A0ACC1K5A1_9FUNG|nr:hypothetical protein IWQ57_001351 [Coemansia nantahalensis]